MTFQTIYNVLRANLKLVFHMYTVLIVYEKRGPSKGQATS